MYSSQSRSVRYKYIYHYIKTIVNQEFCLKASRILSRWSGYSRIYLSSMRTYVVNVFWMLWNFSGGDIEWGDGQRGGDGRWKVSRAKGRVRGCVGGNESATGAEPESRVSRNRWVIATRNLMTNCLSCLVFFFFKPHTKTWCYYIKK